MESAESNIIVSALSVCFTPPPQGGKKKGIRLVVSIKDNVSVAAPRWDLSDLFSGLEDERIGATLATAKADAEAFAAKYRGTVASLTPEQLVQAITESERIRQEAQKPVAFGSLRFAAETSPENGAFMQSVRERYTAATLPLLFFDLELTQLAPEALTGLANEAVLEQYKHYLTTTRDRAKFRLSEAEERVLEEQQNTGRRSWTRLFEEITSSLRFTMEGEPKSLTLSEAIDRQYSSDRDVRRRAADAVTEGLRPHQRTLAFVYNTLIADKATEDRLRGFSYQEEARHVSNELAPEIVETVVQASEVGYALVARYYRAKRELLGLDQLAHYDRYAPIVTQTLPAISYETAQDCCLGAFSKFDSGYESTARAFFTGDWIDAEVRPGKRGGAFCAYVTADTHPYIFMNYLGKTGDVRTLAHELGHGVHASLARPKGFLSFHGTLPMAEVASTFAEQLVFAETQAGLTDDTARLALYAEQIEQAISTIFRQTALYRFEQAAHRERRENGELSVERLGELWQTSVGAMFGDSVTLEPGHALWWSYIPHFIGTPFYVYAYTFGELLALALYKRCQVEGAETFAPRFVQFLSSGGSLSPAELVAPLNVDLADPVFWQGAIAVLEEQIEGFEVLAAKLKK